jgi:hypothetical protein
MARAAFARGDLARVTLTESGSTEKRAFQSDHKMLTKTPPKGDY